MSLHRTFVLRRPEHVAAATVFIRANWAAFADSTPLAVTVMPHKEKRSVEQNKFYWRRLREIADQTWIKGRRYSDQVWHEMFKRQFIGIDDLPNGETCGLSTTTLSVSAFAEYITRVEEHAASQLGVIFND